MLLTLKRVPSHFFAHVPGFLLIQIIHLKSLQSILKINPTYWIRHHASNSALLNRLRCSIFNEIIYRRNLSLHILYEVNVK